MAQERLPGINWHQGEFPRLGAFSQGAIDYQQQRGIGGHNPAAFAATRADTGVTQAIGSQVVRQQGLPSHISPQMRASYGAMNAGIEAQYQHLTSPQSQGGMGINVEFTHGDPYATSSQMASEVGRTGTLKVLRTSSTGDVHPMMTAEQNDKFRAVHDAFGHLATGRGFNIHGEEAAAQHHASMFPPEAHQALFSETRGQISGTTQQRGFVENKPYEMPNWSQQSVPQLPASMQAIGGVQGSLF